MSSPNWPPVDRNANIAASLKFLFDDLGDEECFELCVIGAYGSSPYWIGNASRGTGGKESLVAGWYSRKDIAAAARTAMEVDGGWDVRGERCVASTIAVALNPAKALLKGRSNAGLRYGAGRTGDTDITRVKWLFLDIDPERPSNVQATEEQVEAAQRLAVRVREWMDARGCGKGALAFSGSGFHILYRVALDAEPVSEASKLITQLLKALAARFDGDQRDGDAACKLDTSVGNPSRLIRLWGVTSRKGAEVPENGQWWRQSRIIDLGDTLLRPITKDQLGNLIEEAEREAEEREAEALPDGIGPGTKATSKAARESRKALRAQGMPEGVPTFRNILGVYDPRLRRLAAGPDGRGVGFQRLDVERFLADHSIAIKEHKEWTSREGDVYDMWELEECLFNPEHKGGEAAFLQRKDNGRLKYKCFHTSCGGHTWRDAIAKITGKPVGSGMGVWMTGGTDRIDYAQCNPQTGAPKVVAQNIGKVVDWLGMEIWYDELKKDARIALPGGMWNDVSRVGNAKEAGGAVPASVDACIAFLKDVCKTKGLMASTADLGDYFTLRCQQDRRHPVREWIEAAEWDGVDRLGELAATVKVAEGYEGMWRVYLRKFLIKGVAALYEATFSDRGVLVFCGGQGVGKTQWVKGLVDKSLKAVGEGVTLDPANRDSVLTALSYWLVELGEIGSTFRQADMNRLKAFLTKDSDSVRRPYGRSNEYIARRTVFLGTVNDVAFLHDRTGSSRYWVVGVESIDWMALSGNGGRLDMQQVWAQALALYGSAETWFLNRKEQQASEALNEGHEEEDPMERAIYKRFDFDAPKEAWVNLMTASDVAEAIYMGEDLHKGGHGRALVTRIGVALSSKFKIYSQLRRVKGVRGRFFSMPPLLGDAGNARVLQDFLPQ